MLHFNSHLPCIIDVETTGTDPLLHEMWQIAILPLSDDLQPHDEIIPFSFYLRVEKPEAIDPAAMHKTRTKFLHSQPTAMNPLYCLDLFNLWFERLNLPLYKRILPIGMNWPFDRDFLIAWMGRDLFQQIFWGIYRDVMAIATYLNDVSSFFGHSVPFHHVNLSTLCQLTDIQNHSPHDALQDCIATAAVYRKLLAHFVKD